MKNSIIWGLVASCFIWVSCTVEILFVHKVVNLSKQPLIVSYHIVSDSIVIQKDTITPNHEFMIFNGSEHSVPSTSVIIDTIQTENGSVVKKDWNNHGNWESREYEKEGIITLFSLFFLWEEDL